MGKTFTRLTDEELCDLMCGKPEEDNIPIIDNDFIASGHFFDLMNDIANVRDREIKQKCENA